MCPTNFSSINRSNGSKDFEESKSEQDEDVTADSVDSPVL
jgi:hypothetical protein